MKTLVHWLCRSLWVAGVIVLLMSACKWEAPSAVKLVSGNKIFMLPPQYPTVEKSEDMLAFQLHYPSMAPISPGKSPVGDQVEIYLSRVQNRHRAASDFNLEWQEKLSPQYDPEFSWKAYGGERQGLYQRYFSGAPERIVASIYLFQASDGQLVRVRVPVFSRSMSRAFRSLDRERDFDLTYNFAQSIDKDLIQFDRDISDFLKQHIHTTP